MSAAESKPADEPASTDDPAATPDPIDQRIAEERQMFRNLNGPLPNVPMLGRVNFSIAPKVLSKALQQCANFRKSNDGNGFAYNAQLEEIFTRRDFNKYAISKAMDRPYVTFTATPDNKLNIELIVERRISFSTPYYIIVDCDTVTEAGSIAVRLDTIRKFMPKLSKSKTVVTIAADGSDDLVHITQGKMKNIIVNEYNPALIKRKALDAPAPMPVGEPAETVKSAAIASTNKSAKKFLGLIDQVKVNRKYAERYTAEAQAKYKQGDYVKAIREANCASFEAQRACENGNGALFIYQCEISAQAEKLLKLGIGYKVNEWLENIKEKVEEAIRDYTATRETADKAREIGARAKEVIAAFNAEIIAAQEELPKAEAFDAMIEALEPTPAPSTPTKPAADAPKSDPSVESKWQSAMQAEIARRGYDTNKIIVCTMPPAEPAPASTPSGTTPILRPAAIMCCAMPGLRRNLNETAINFSRRY